MTLYLIAISLQCNSKYLKSKLKNKNTVKKNLCIHAYFISWSHLSAPLAYIEDDTLVLCWSQHHSTSLSLSEVASTNHHHHTSHSPVLTTLLATTHQHELHTWPVSMLQPLRHKHSTPGLWSTRAHSNRHQHLRVRRQCKGNSLLSFYSICSRMAGFNKIHTLLYLKNFNLSKYCTQETSTRALKGLSKWDYSWKLVHDIVSLLQEIVILCLLLLLVIYSIWMFINNWSRNYRDIYQPAFITYNTHESEEGEEAREHHFSTSKRFVML